MIDLRNHYGFTRTPFGKDLAPSMLCHLTWLMFVG